MIRTLKKIFLAFTKRERISFLLASLIGVLVIVSLLGLTVGASTKTVPTSGGEYTIGLTGQPINLNPVLASNDNDKVLLRLLFSNLYDIADKIEKENNGRLWTVRLKENAKWSDGTKLTSDDIIFTVQRIQDPASASPLFASWQGVTVSRVSELELRFFLASPYSFFEDNIKNLYVIPKHLFAEVPTVNWRLSDYNLKPIGSGPYILKSYNKDRNGFINYFNLTANSFYFNNPPFVKNLVVKFSPTNDGLIKSFNEGSVDSFSGPDPESLSKIKRSYNAFAMTMPVYYAIFLNQGQNLALKEAAVRLAMDTVLDKKSLTSDIFKEHAVPLYGVTRDNTNNLTDPSKDRIALANKILDDTGWIKDDSGLRSKTSKNSDIKLEIEITVPQISFLAETAQKIQSVWQDIGIRTNIKTFPPDEITDRIIKNRDYQAIIFGNVLNPNYDLYSFWHSSERFYPGLNLSIYNNSAVDDLIENIREDMDPQAIMADFDKLTSIIKNDHPAIFLYSPDYLLIANKELKGVKTRTITEPADLFLDARNWYLKTARVFK
jgi:peptide/nickel transport system substrate-binding protein